MVAGSVTSVKTTTLREEFFATDVRNQKVLAIEMASQLTCFLHKKVNDLLSKAKMLTLIKSINWQVY
jgi:hypothetical protein